MKLARSISVLIVLVAITAFQAVGQSVGIGGSNFIPHSSSILELQHDAKGVLLPRLTTSQRADITTPAKGLIIFNEETDHFEFWDGARWVEISNDNDNPTFLGTIYQTLRHNGTTWVANNALRSNGVSVGIGTAPGAYALDVAGTVNATGLRMPTNAGTGKVFVSNDANGFGAWVDPDFFCTVCDPPPDDSFFVISENDSSLIVARQPDNSDKSFVIGSQILGDPDFTLPAEWEARMFFDRDSTNAFRVVFLTMELGIWPI
jgi:hypothetical protein